MYLHEYALISSCNMIGAKICMNRADISRDGLRHIQSIMLFTAGMKSLNHIQKDSVWDWREIAERPVAYSTQRFRAIIYLPPKWWIVDALFILSNGSGR